MSSKLYLAIGLIVYLAVAGWFTLKAAIPKKSEIESQATKVEVVSEEKVEEKLNNPIVNKLKDPANYIQFGLIPVQISKEEQGKENPFQ